MRFFVFFLCYVGLTCTSFTHLYIAPHVVRVVSLSPLLISAELGLKYFSEICKFFYNIFLFYQTYIVNFALLLNNRGTKLE